MKPQGAKTLGALCGALFVLFLLNVMNLRLAEIREDCDAMRLEHLELQLSAQIMGLNEAVLSNASPTNKDNARFNSAKKIERLETKLRAWKLNAKASCSKADSTQWIVTTFEGLYNALAVIFGLFAGIWLAELPKVNARHKRKTKTQRQEETNG